MISVDLAVVKQVVSKVLYEAINVLSKSFMRFLGKNLFVTEDYALHCSSPDEHTDVSKHGARAPCPRSAAVIRSGWQCRPRAAPFPQIQLFVGATAGNCSEPPPEPSSVRWCQMRVGNYQEQGR